MTTYYVDSVSGSNTAPYDTWAKAATSFATVSAIPLVASDIVYVASTHAGGDYAASATLVPAGAVNTAVKVICADKTSGNPPSTIATGGIIEVTGASHTLATNSAATYAEFYGITFRSGASQSTNCAITISANAYLENCRIEYLSTNTASNVTLGTMCTCKNVTFKMGATAQTIAMSQGARILGGALDAASSAITNLFSPTGANEIHNFDATHAASAANIFISSGSNVTAIASKIAMPTPTWTGTVCAAISSPSIFEATNYGNSGSSVNYFRRTAYGSVETETTVLMTSGASDGTTSVSRKMTSTSNAGLYPMSALSTADFVVWNDTTGSSMTKTIEIFTSAGGIKDNEFWFTVWYPADSGDPLGGVVTTAPDWLNAGSTLASSSASWTGMSGTAQKATTPSFTPQQKGYLYFRMYLGKASQTLYFNPPQS